MKLCTALRLWTSPPTAPGRLRPAAEARPSPSNGLQAWPRICIESQECLAGGAEFSQELFDASTIVRLLGILKAGAAYLPLDPACPPERLAFMLSDAEASLVLTQQGLLERLPSSGLETLCLDGDWPAPAESQALAHPAHVLPDSLAYLIYTSGTTGRPKGMQVRHGNVSRLFDATQDWFDFGPHDGAAHSVRRLRLLAKELAEGPGSGRAAGLLEAKAGRCGCAGAAHRPSPPGASPLSGRCPDVRLAREACGIPPGLGAH